MQRTNLIPIFKNAYLSSHFVGWMCCVKGQKIEYSASNKETGKEYNKWAIIELTFDLIEFVCFRLSLLQMEPSIMHQLNQHRSTIFQLINFPLPPQRPQVFIHLAFQRCIHKRYLISHSINTTVYQWYVLASDFYCLRENRIFSNNLASFSFHCGSFRPWQPPHRMYLPYGRKIIKVNSIKSFPMKIFYWLLTLTVWTKKKMKSTSTSPFACHNTENHIHTMCDMRWNSFTTICKNWTKKKLDNYLRCVRAKWWHNEMKWK